MTDEVVEDQGVGALAAVFGQDADEEQVDGVGLMPFQDLQQMPPSEGQEAAVMGLLQRPGERGEGDAEAYHLVAVHDGGHEVKVGNLDIVVDQFVNLLLGELAEAVEILVGCIQQVEDLLAAAFLNQFVTGELMDAQVVAFAHHLRNLRKLVGHHFRYLDPALHIIVVFLETLHLRHMLGVVGMVVVDIHGGEPVETFNEHALAVGVDEAQRTGYLCHTFLASPVFDGFQQGGRYFRVIDEVEPSEADGITVPAFVGPAVDDGGHSTYHLFVLIGQEILCLATLERRVLVAAQSGHFIGIEERHGTVVVAVQVVVELDKLLQFALGFNTFDLNHWCKVTNKRENNQIILSFSNEYSECVDVFVEFFVEGMAGHGRGIAEDDQLHAGAGDSHIHPSQVAQETDLSFVVGADEGDEDDVAFLTLETIDGVHADQVAVGLEELTFLEQPPQVLHLSTVGGDDTDIEAFVEDAGFADLLEVLLQGEESQLCLGLVDAAEGLADELLFE